MHKFMHACVASYNIILILIQFDVITRDMLNQACGGSGSELLQPSGIITVLFVVMYAFVY